MRRARESTPDAMAFLPGGRRTDIEPAWEQDDVEGAAGGPSRRADRAPEARPNGCVSPVILTRMRHPVPHREPGEARGGAPRHRSRAAARDSAGRLWPEPDAVNGGHWC